MTRLLPALASTFIASSLAASIPAAAVRQHDLHRYEATRMSMGCVYAIEVYGSDAQTIARVVHEALDEVDRIDRLMSHYKSESPLSRLNLEAAQHPVTVEPELFDFIVDAMRYNRESGGAFDVTVGPLMKVWGFFRGEGRVPADPELAIARRHVGGAHVILDSTRKTIRFDEPGVELDLGGIAKGYAVDRVVRLLERRGMSAALISAGGSTIYALGSPPDGEGFELAIQDPVESQKTALKVRLKNRALSVAGSSEKSFESGGMTYSHIMDPRTGRPAQGVLSVAVLADSGTAGDALDDALFVLGVDGSRAYLKQLPGTEAFLFLPDTTRTWTLVHLRGGR